MPSTTLRLDSWIYKYRTQLITYPVKKLSSNSEQNLFFDNMIIMAMLMMMLMMTVIVMMMGMINGDLFSIIRLIVICL